MKKTKKMIFIVLLLINSFYLLIDLKYFFIDRLKSNQSLIYEFSNEPKYLVFFKWAIILINIVYLFKTIERGKVYFKILLVSNILILVLFSYNFFLGNIYRGSFLFNAAVLELLSFVSLLYLIITKKR